EGGFDLTLWNGRATAEVTGYSKYTHDALFNVGLGLELPWSIYENVGDVRNSGVEANVVATVLESRSINWVVSVNASVNTNKLIRLAPGVPIAGAGYGQQFAPGYPLYGYWGNALLFADSNTDGIIERNEVSSAPKQSYRGASLPKQEISLSSHFGFW